MSLRRVYETTVIINAALEDQDIDAVISKITNYIENHGGELMETNKWGRRRLAYPINKKFNGYYVHLVFTTVPSVVPVLERFLILEDTVLRHLTLILPERLRELRQEKALAEGKVGEGTSMTSGLDEPRETGRRPQRDFNRNNAEVANADAPATEEAPVAKETAIAEAPAAEEKVETAEVSEKL